MSQLRGIKRVQRRQRVESVVGRQRIRQPSWSIAEVSMTAAQRFEIVDTACTIERLGPEQSQRSNSAPRVSHIVPAAEELAVNVHWPRLVGETAVGHLAALQP